MGPADQLTVARIAAAPVIVALFVIDFRGHDYWVTALLAVAMATDWVDGRVARRSGRPSAVGSLLDAVADKILVPFSTRATSESSRRGSSQSRRSAGSPPRAPSTMRSPGGRPLAALVITWLSGLDYARVAPSLLRRRAPA